MNSYFQCYLLTGKNIRKRNQCNCAYSGSIITKCNITVVGKIYTRQSSTIKDDLKTTTILSSL
jgi:hypothetical protein